jgi:sugar O-acyltransferase (sialic acid O-acetyltransferase NeuD family)
MEYIMKKNFIFGYGGFAKEIDFYLKMKDPECENIFIITLDKDHVFLDKNKFITEDDFYRTQEDCQCYIGIANPLIRKKIASKFLYKPNFKFPNLFCIDTLYDQETIMLGIGNIMCPGVKMTKNISLGNFNIINLNSTIGHDTIIEDYVTISPGCNVSGNVFISSEIFLGTNSTILENLKIKEKCIIGAGCLVNKNILTTGTFVGVPAKKIK